jgi:hypothetical protein
MENADMENADMENADMTNHVDCFSKVFWLYIF